MLRAHINDDFVRAENSRLNVYAVIQHGIHFAALSF
jgi:hypothetical protein